MPTLSVDIPAGMTNRVLDAISAEYNYNPLTDGTKAAFAKKQVIEFLKRTVKASEKSASFKSTAQTIETDVETNIGIT